MHPGGVRAASDRGEGAASPSVRMGVQRKHGWMSTTKEEHVGGVCVCGRGVCVYVCVCERVCGRAKRECVCERVCVGGERECVCGQSVCALILMSGQWLGGRGTYCCWEDCGAIIPGYPPPYRWLGPWAGGPCM